VGVEGPENARRRKNAVRRSKAALRPQPNLVEEARRVSGSEAAALRTEQYFRERAGRADVAKAKRILKRAGKGNPLVPGDEV